MAVIPVSSVWFDAEESRDTGRRKCLFWCLLVESLSISAGGWREFLWHDAGARA
jgi:hypothetical protein